MNTTLDDPANNPIDNVVTIAENVNNCIMPEFPKPFEETKWLVMSSCTFLIPTVYAFASSLYLYGCVSLFTMVFSINHWRDAEDGIRRAIDCYAAYICFVVFFVSGCIYCRGIYLYVYGLLITIITVTLFLISNHLSIQGHNRWYFAHMLFHLSVIVSESLIIYCIVQSYEECDQVVTCVAPTNP